ncbi:MAG: SDR family oxidoreductase [Burkholderiaceae bacterium]
MSANWVLVTGGAVRLGREICLAFARSGWHVMCHYRHSQDQALATCHAVRSLGVQALPVQCDLDDTADQTRMYQSACAAAGAAPAAVVNNASLFEPDTGGQLDGAGFQRQMRTNVLAPLQFGALLAQQAWPDAAHPRVLLHVLDQKVFNLNPDYFSYTVSKLALERCVALQAQALAPQIRVVGVAPGLIYESGPQSRENFERASRVNLMRQPTDPLDVAKTCVFLAETPSINGITVCVDQGQHLVPLARDIMFVADALKAPPA